MGEHNTADCGHAGLAVVVASLNLGRGCFATVSRRTQLSIPPRVS